MTQPAVTITELDGALGNLATGGLLALVGASSKGPLNIPATFARIADVQANFGTGPLVEAAARAIDLYGQPVCVVRAGMLGTPGEYGPIDVSGVTGTSVATTDEASPPLGSYEVELTVTTGGTIGSAGIMLTSSLDGGTTTSPAQALGTAASITIPSSGVKINFAAGTLVTGDVITVSTTAPIPGTPVGAYSDIDVTGVTGTSVATLDETVKPFDSYQVVIKVVAGGTLGVAGIQLTVSLDNGNTTSQPQAVGVDLFFTITEANIKVLFAAGTLVAGDVITFSSFAPNPDSTTYGTALTALGNSQVAWRVCEIVGTVDAATAGAIDQKFVGLQAAHKPRYFIANTRLPDFIVGETAAEYLEDLSTAFADFATKFGSVAAGAVQLPSSVSGRQYKVPVNYAAGPLIASVDEDVDVADINIGVLPGAKLTDTNGNPILGLHDESLNPGLDDARFLTLRTWVGVQGVYVNRPRVMSATGSDFYLVPHRLIMNLAEDALYQYLIRRLNQGVPVNKKTGFIVESARLEIEAGGTAAMAAVLLAKPKASDCSFALSKFDNVLSTKTLTGEARVLPFGYVEEIKVNIGYVNPALRVLVAA